MNKKGFIIAVIAVLLLLAVTCPDKKDHIDKIQDTVSTQIKRNNGGDALSIIGSFVALKVIDIYLDTAFDVDNYVFFSIGKINYAGEEIGTSFGILHHVFIYGGKNVADAIKESAGNYE